MCCCPWLVPFWQSTRQPQRSCHSPPPPPLPLAGMHCRDLHASSACMRILVSLCTHLSAVPAHSPRPGLLHPPSRGAAGCHPVSVTSGVHVNLDANVLQVTSVQLQTAAWYVPSAPPPLSCPAHPACPHPGQCVIITIIITIMSAAGGPLWATTVRPWAVSPYLPTLPLTVPHTAPLRHLKAPGA